MYVKDWCAERWQKMLQCFVRNTSKATFFFFFFWVKNTFPSYHKAVKESLDLTHNKYKTLDLIQSASAFHLKSFYIYIYIQIYLFSLLILIVMVCNCSFYQLSYTTVRAFHEKALKPRTQSVIDQVSNKYDAVCKS